MLDLYEPRRLYATEKGAMNMDYLDSLIVKHCKPKDKCTYEKEFEIGQTNLHPFESTKIKCKIRLL